VRSCPSRATFFARAYVIPAERPIALRASEQVVVEEIPDDGRRAGGTSTTRVTLP
jgi:hypothetical protein